MQYFCNIRVLFRTIKTFLLSVWNTRNFEISLKLFDLLDETPNWIGCWLARILTEIPPQTLGQDELILYWPYQPPVKLHEK